MIAPYFADDTVTIYCGDCREVMPQLGAIADAVIGDPPYARSCHGHAIHPTQKPTAILRPLIEHSVPRGGVVLDPFGGSGSTAEAARELGRRAVIIELDEGWCAEMVRRLAQVPLSLGANA